MCGTRFRTGLMRQRQGSSLRPHTRQISFRTAAREVIEMAKEKIITRKKIFDMINQTDENNRLSEIYGFGMLIVILVSLIPLAFKEETLPLKIIEYVCVSIFVLDYILRLITADYKYEKKSVVSFIRYPFSPMAIFDIISILPSLTALNKGFKVLRVLRMGRLMRVFRIFRAFRHSKNIRIIQNVFLRSKKSLIAVGSLAVGYILISALIAFNVEPDTFANFFEAVYWATISLTTVGYGDIYMVSAAGKVITMLSAFVGIAVVALPAGIITAGYMSEIGKTTDENDPD